MSRIETNSCRVVIASAVVLAAGLALQIAGIYARSVSGNHIMTIIGKAGTVIGGTGAGIALSIYVLKRWEKDPTIYDKLIIPLFTGIIFGSCLTSLMLPAPVKILGQSILSISGGIGVGMPCYAIYMRTYGKNRESSADAPRPVNHPAEGQKPAATSRTYNLRGTVKDIQDSHGVKNAKQRQKDVALFQKAEHTSVRTILFGRQSSQFLLLLQTHTPPDEKLFQGEFVTENTRGFIVSYNGKPYTLAKNQQGHLLRLSGETNVTAEIWDGREWKTQKSWLPQDEQFQSFATFVMKGAVEDETSM